MSDLLTELFAEMLKLRYGEKDIEAAATMARFARLAIQPQPERRRRRQSPAPATQAVEGTPAPVGLCGAAPGAGDQMPEIPENLRRVPRA